MVTASAPNRPAVTFLNYRGRVEVNPLVPMGPNTIGELLWPVEATYDDQTDRTRVGFSYIAPVRACRSCGCTDEAACPGGCSWVAADLCSACSPLEVAP